MSDTIKEFLVGLGFDVDEAGASRFHAGISGATKAIAGLGAASVAAAGLVTAFVDNVAEKYDALGDLGYEVNATARDIQELGYIAQFTDSSTEAVASSLSGLAKAAGDTSLGIGRAKKIFDEIGVSVLDASGHVKDTTTLLYDVKDAIQDLDKGTQRSVLSRLGIDPTLLKLLTQDISGLRAEFSDLYGTLGIDTNAAAEASGNFLDNFGKLKRVWEAGSDALGLRLLPQVSESIIQFRKFALDALPGVVEGADNVLSAVLSVAGGFGVLAGRGVEVGRTGAGWLAGLTGGAENLALVGSGLLAIFTDLDAKLVKFVLSPAGLTIGAIIGLTTAYDDLQTYLEGGDAYFDWGSYSSDILNAAKSVKTLAERVVLGLVEALKTARDVGRDLLGVVRRIIELWPQIKTDQLDLSLPDDASAWERFLALVVALGIGLARAIEIAWDFGAALVRVARNVIDHWDDVPSAISDALRSAFPELYAAISELGTALLDLWTLVSGAVVGVARAFNALFAALASGAPSQDKAQASWRAGVTWLGKLLYAVVTLAASLAVGLVNALNVVIVAVASLIEGLGAALDVAQLFATDAIEVIARGAQRIKSDWGDVVAWLGQDIEMPAPTIPDWSWPSLPSIALPTIDIRGWMRRATSIVAGWSWPGLPSIELPGIDVREWMRRATSIVAGWSWPSLPSIALPTIDIRGWMRRATSIVAGWSWPSLPSIELPGIDVREWVRRATSIVAGWSWPSLPTIELPTIDVRDWMQRATSVVAGWAWPSLPSIELPGIDIREWVRRATSIVAGWSWPSLPSIALPTIDVRGWMQRAASVVVGWAWPSLPSIELPSIDIRGWMRTAETIGTAFADAFRRVAREAKDRLGDVGEYLRGLLPIAQSVERWLRSVFADAWRYVSEAAQRFFDVVSIGLDALISFLQRVVDLISINLLGAWESFTEAIRDFHLPDINVGEMLGTAKHRIEHVFGSEPDKAQSTPTLPSAAPPHLVPSAATQNNLSSTSNSSTWNINPKTEIKITGGGSPQSTAREVARAQTGVNKDLVRNLRPAIA